MKKEFIEKMKNAFTEYFNSSEQVDLKQRLVENEQWFRLRQKVRGQDSRIPDVRTGYLFNAILTKHADAMDNYPDINILPREESDSELAQTLTGVIPFVLEQNDFESVYSENWYSKLKTSACYCVTWDTEANGGLGDIKISKTDLLHLYWQPGVSDIQDSEFVFYENFMPAHEFKAKYGENAYRISGKANFTYAYESFKLSFKNEMVHVIDCYYKIYDKNKIPKLHFCTFSGDYIIYASEDKSDESGVKLFKNGYYEHGKYPFVFDVMYSAEQSVAGFSLVDVLRPMQEYIDSNYALILRNNRLVGNPRYLVSSSLGVNVEDFADLKKEIIEVEGSIDNSNYRRLEADQLPAQVSTSLDYYIAQVKEVIGNRDFQQGGTSNGVTSGTALSVLQSVGDKLSRDIIKSSYRAYKKIILLVIELMRQFYSVERTVRITGKDGDYEFKTFDNSKLNPLRVSPDDFSRDYLTGNYPSVNDNGNVESDGAEGFGQIGVNRAELNLEQADENIAGISSETGDLHIPYFDVKLSVQKSNPYSRELSNQTILELVNTGLLNPQNLEFNMPILRALQFEGKDALLKELSEVSEKYNQQNQKIAELQQQISVLQNQMSNSVGASDGMPLPDMSNMVELPTP